MERNENKPIIGISTGLACPDMSLAEATRFLASKDGVRAVELCVNGFKASDVLPELRAIQKGEGLVYSVHTPASFKYDPTAPLEASIEAHLDHISQSLIVAAELDVRNLVQHPPLNGGVPLPEEVRDTYLQIFGQRLDQLGIRDQATIEDGVMRRDLSVSYRPAPFVNEEEGRTPEALAVYAKNVNAGQIVADVAKMSRWTETPENSVMRMDNIDEFIKRAKELGLTIPEVQLIGVGPQRWWADDLEYNAHTIRKMAEAGFLNQLFILEVWPDRLDITLEAAKEALAEVGN